MEKPRWEESEKRNEEERKIREEKESEERRCVKRKEMQVREKVENRRSAEPSCGRRVEQFHAVGVRSRFGSKNAKKTAATSYFWKLRCGKSARDCGGKHILESKTLQLRCTLGRWAHALVARSRNAQKNHSRSTVGSWDIEKVYAAVAPSTFNLQVRNVKYGRSRTTFGRWDVDKVHAVVAWSTFASQKC